MARIVGVHGGNSVFLLGDVADVQSFFDCLKDLIANSHSAADWSILTERLYKRYLRREDQEVAGFLLSQAERLFDDAASPKLHFGESRLIRSGDIHCPKTEFHKDYFDRIRKADEMSKSFLATFSIFQPVRLVVADEPWFTMETERSLIEYDLLEGKPFWVEWRNPERFSQGGRVM